MLPGNTVGSLTPTQHSILVGSLLGDGYLRRQGTRKNAYFEANHSLEARPYVDWKWRHFHQHVLTPPKSRQGNGNRIAYRFFTRSIPVFTQYYEWFYRDGKKHIPVDIQLDPLILAVWFMDDGSKSYRACYLNTQQFCLDDQWLLQQLLFNTFGIQSTLNRDKQYFRIRITTESTTRLVGIIRPYVLLHFQYKLVDDPVTTALERARL